METRILKTLSRTILSQKILLVLLFCSLIIPSQAVLNPFAFSTLSSVVLEDTLSTTQLVAANQNNVAGGVSAVTNIGFNFVLNGVTYTQFSINDNGVMRLGSTVVSIGTTTANQLTANADFPKIAAYFDDTKTQTGTIRYKVIGSAPNRKLMVQWNVTIGTTLNSKYQIWLFETSNNIQFVYGQNVPANTGNYSVGVATATTDFGSITVSSTFASSTISYVTSNDLNQAAITSGNSFLLTAAPSCPALTAPAANATNVQPTSQTLSWTAGSTGVTTGYDVYFGTSSTPPIVSTNQVGTTYSTGALANNTIYYWKVVGRNGSALSGSCSTIQFTTAAAPGCPVISYPGASAVNIPTTSNVILTWSAGSGTTNGYDVYFGTASNPPIVSTNQAGTTYNAGLLNSGTVYYWSVIGRNGAALSSGCLVNQFTTKSLINFNVARTTGVSYSSILPTGTTITSWRNGDNTDDNLSNSIPIGFNFNYGGMTYSNFLVSTNGFITFNTAASGSGNAPTPYGYNDSALANYFSSPSTLVLAPYYYDMVCQGNSNLPGGIAASIKYKLTGVFPNRILTVEWSGMELYVSSGPNLNFQIKLYETTNNIDFVYGQMEGFNGSFSHNYSASIGLNGSSLSNIPVAGEVFNQLTSNTRNFGVTPYCNQNIIPDCYTQLRFTPGNYTAYVPVSNVPSNDSLGSPIQLFVNPFPCIDLCGSYYTSANATNSGIAGCQFTNADDDVWFVFTAPSTTSATIKVSGAGNYNATVELFNSSMVSLACGNSGGPGFSETINSNITLGQQYFVRVFHNGTGWNSNNSSGQFSICVSATPLPPSNDDCANAITLPVTLNVNYIAGTSTYAATPSPGVPLCSVAGTTPDDDVWYKFTAPNSGEVISVNGLTGFNAVIQILNGTCNVLNPIACVNLFQNGQVENLNATGLTPNTNYYVRVYHAGIGGGTGNYGISVYSPPPGCISAVSPADQDTMVPVYGTQLIWDSVSYATKYRVLLDTVNPPVNPLFISTDNFGSLGILRGGKTYYWKVEPGNETGFNTSCQVSSFTTEPTPFLLRVKVFVEGIYNGNLAMKPLIDPLDTLADTITISLADSTTRDIEFSANAIMSIHGYAEAYFPAGVDQKYLYISATHRNSLEIWTPTPFPFLSLDSSYNFSDNSTKVFAENVIQLAPGIFGMHMGDLNQDYFINYADMDVFKDATSEFMYGWFNEDLNCDGYVESIDCSLLENKISLGLSVKIPGVFEHP